MVPVKHCTYEKKKRNGQIQCCIDFRNLNRVCPKEKFMLPNMGLLIDSTNAMSSFMEESRWYNQIRMTPKDAEKLPLEYALGIVLHSDACQVKKCRHDLSTHYDRHIS